MDKKLKLIETEDGSHSIYVPDLNETYHSFHGAYRESVHVFLLYGLEHWAVHNPEKEPIRIFEVGFGTGLNAWLTLVWAEQNKRPVLYHSIEPFPIPEEIYQKLNYTRVDKTIQHFEDYFQELHKAPWDHGDAITPYFNMKKEQTTLQDVQLYHSDVVFFDAFAPSKQPELWAKDLLKKVVDHMNPGGVFVTYCAKGQLKRDLAELGLKVETLPGPPGKKEMVRGRKV
ncbi:tRNA (5-methylaminomethyl-2-thiouridine)(34)-methyltransferase MnmD [Echinicola jeungdonensis]|uniref:tRNA (5-methylaminomethyl-2-thiouridine)(34)-methyltransferase MnmD n=1 Tax=Echinicola jeungdonensis TaxID=709343 RepID=A0ABV5J6K4_9BACT|nr:tRNA (5-methylaminomethyl-2-thiouridine)(34)-methyltransferase MnmD [Echinicola jeungdonensis]MDN3668864.1 tRNA (5-methylaminomethyl-2-thiouridine)(34)-methyltransferase MnmD [Echinicola jeungdonensis]